MNKQERDRNGQNKQHIHPGITFETSAGRVKVEPVEKDYLKGAMKIADRTAREEVIAFLRK